MKITGFGPMIISPKADDIIRLFEELGFEKNHTKSDIEGGQNINVNLKDADGHRLDVASSGYILEDLFSIRINVDNFQEAYDFFLAHGFKNTRGDKVTETSSSVDAFLVSPSGFAVTLVQHIK